MSTWANVAVAPPDPIFNLAARCRADTDPNKIDLGIGAYRDENGKPYLLKVVAKVEVQLAEAKLDKEYLPIDGLASFRECSAKLLLGDNSPAIAEKRIASIQSLSGTGCLRLAAEFYKNQLGCDIPVYISDPTWGNHKTLFNIVGFKSVKSYRYFHKETKGVDFAGMTEDLKAAPDGAIVLLQACAHNPTGADPTEEEWLELSKICKEKKFVVLFDSAYQGYASGDPDKDAYSCRLFESEGVEFACAQSYAKNFGLYGERVGCLLFCTPTPEIATAVSSQLKVIARPMYSNPPVHGARIVSTILSDPALKAEWLQEIKSMAGRIHSMRAGLYDALQKNGAPGDWSHVIKQIGMFSFTGLTPAQCEHLITKHHVYLLSNGRISVAGLGAGSLAKLADAMKDAVENC